MQMRLDVANGLDMTVEHSKMVERFIREIHYLGATPAGAMIRMVFWYDGEPIGAMMWGHPTARALDQEHIMELTRMCFTDKTPHCIESRALGMARKHIRKHHPRINGLIAYASTGQGHEGTVYLADGWFCVGQTRSSSWTNRPGRVDRDLSDKLRFVRTP